MENLSLKNVINPKQVAERLDFRPIEDGDIQLINSLLQGAYSRTCDYTVGGIMMWVKYFGYEYCVVDGTLFIKGRTENHRSETSFMLPIGALPTDEAVSMIIDYCKAEEIKPVFSAVPDDRMDVLLNVLPGADVEALDDWADYMYDIKALASFSGKHLSKKRNHFNQFVNANPGWRLESIGCRNIAEVKAFLERLGAGEAEKSDLARNEYEECRRVLANYDLYPFEGALLRCADGSVAAFAVGEVVGDTLFVHIEKMDHAVDGSGAAICKLFSEYMLGRHTGLRFVNREEDCGDPGLRNAKEQYHPLTRLQKFNVRAV